MVGSRRRAVRLSLAVVSALGLLVPAACSGTQGSPQNAGEDGPTSFRVISNSPDMLDVLTTLSTGACAQANKALPLKTQSIGTENVIQKITLLASQDALPPAFTAGTSMIRPDGDLGRKHLVLDYQQSLKKLGKWDDINPAAANTVQQIYGGMYSLPYQYNIEGIFYNKAIFAKYGIAEPKTWDEFVSALEKLKQHDVIPITEGGADGWPLGRLLGMYIFRKLGPEAMKDVVSGKTKFTDPGYVEAAAAVAALAEKGYFGPGLLSRSQDAAEAQFLTGKAAMIYDGSWLLAGINDDKQDKIGAENIGLMPFPTVPGGVGTRDQWPANAGAPQAMSSEAYGPKVADWLGCIADNYGTQAMKDKGIVSGFKTDLDAVGDIPPMTKKVQQIVDGLPSTSLLWFGALLPEQTADVSSQYMPMLYNGKMSAQDFAAKIQSSLEKSRK